MSPAAGVHRGHVGRPQDLVLMTAVDRMSATGATRGRRVRKYRVAPRTQDRFGVPAELHGLNHGPDSSPTALRIAGRMTRTLPSTTGAPQTPISITRAPSPARRAYEVARMPNPVAP